ncbi:MAG: hypothetical protein LBV58_01940 [Acholeplasmatales bacterium]|jgi:hypothetical protein|nr:hypothetical protein [Acholeplasmatales bacterium]
MKKLKNILITVIIPLVSLFLIGCKSNFGIFLETFSSDIFFYTYEINYAFFDDGGLVSSVSYKITTQNDNYFKIEESRKTLNEIPSMTKYSVEENEYNLLDCSSYILSLDFEKDSFTEYLISKDSVVELRGHLKDDKTGKVFNNQLKGSDFIVYFLIDRNTFSSGTIEFLTLNGLLGKIDIYIQHKKD